MKEYDILSVQPTSDKALQLACTDLSNPGPNQVRQLNLPKSPNMVKLIRWDWQLSIITLPLHEKPYQFRLNRKQIRQAQRNGVVVRSTLFLSLKHSSRLKLVPQFEILYAAGLFPTPTLPPEVARRYRQNFMSNAREVIRVTGGKGVVFSSGPGGSAEGMRGPLDVINLCVPITIVTRQWGECELMEDRAAILGMPANLAKDAVSLNPKMVLLRARVFFFLDATDEN